MITHQRGVERVRLSFKWREKLMIKDLFIVILWLRLTDLIDK